MTNRPPPEDETHVVSAEGLRAAVLTYLDHMDKREPYANVHADIQQAGMGGPDFTVDRHFDGDGCFAEMERVALRNTGPRPDSALDVERLTEALTSQHVRRYVMEAWVDTGVSEPGYATSRDMAEAIAREYARLSTPHTETSE